MSPVYEAIEPLHPRWGEISTGQGEIWVRAVALDFGDPKAERERADLLALADVSALPRLTVKGPAAESMLRRMFAVPDEIYQIQPLPGDGLMVRTGSSEFFLEDGFRGEVVASVEKDLGCGGNGVYPVLRQDASFLLSGRRALEVLAQTSAANFRETPGFVTTRVAGVSASVFPRTLNGLAVYQLWLDYSYGSYLWERLVEIVQELDGSVIGVAGFFLQEASL
jgi:glycine cleavage system aminomethyltransferase T